MTKQRNRVKEREVKDNKMEKLNSKNQRVVDQANANEFDKKVKEKGKDLKKKAKEQEKATKEKEAKKDPCYRQEPTGCEGALGEERAYKKEDKRWCQQKCVKQFAADENVNDRAARRWKEDGKCKGCQAFVENIEKKDPELSNEAANEFPVYYNQAIDYCNVGCFVTKLRL